MSAVGKGGEARAAYERALELTQQEPERRFIEARLRRWSDVILLAGPFVEQARSGRRGLMIKSRSHQTLWERACSLGVANGRIRLFQHLAQQPAPRRPRRMQAVTTAHPPTPVSASRAPPVPASDPVPKRSTSQRGSGAQPKPPLGHFQQHQVTRRRPDAPFRPALIGIDDGRQAQFAMLLQHVLIDVFQRRQRMIAVTRTGRFPCARPPSN